MIVAIARTVRAVSVWLGISVALAGCAFAQHTYTYTGPYFTNWNFVSPSPDCSPVGGCSPYSSANRVTASLTLSAPFPPNVTNYTVISANVVGYVFSDGNQTYTLGEPGIRFRQAQVSTDAGGNITSARFDMVKWRDNAASGHSAGVSDTTNLSQRLDILAINSLGTNDFGGRNYYCQTYSFGTDSCSILVSDNYMRFGNVPSAAGVWVTSPPVSVPTLAEWVMMLLAGLLAAVGVLHLRKQRASLSA